ncbi:MFS transporter [Phycicoccus endophyticus]|uniref:MFS transporter n=1 Tax=Phycicoccus endophyticus TaxID=1690220 RepID=A0A7G9R5R9_9MICO|nr:MFS transporter [Phycicoccus endophyticus]NHI18436.1 MFS transporter [Phycicoccus endophyticus]QNN50944.1 MFS transporter [Phycicoccus endophyticus]
MPPAAAADDLTGPSALDLAPPTRPRRVLAWGMWDWGTQPFNTVITTFVFSVYLTSSSFGSTNTTSTALSVSTALAGLFVALLAPVLGQNSDRSGRTVHHLRVQTWLLALLSAALFVVRPEPGFLWVGLGLLAAGSVVSEIAGVNYNSTIDQVATPRTVGRVSGFGWGMGYLGGIIVLLLIYFAFIQPEVGLFGVTDADGLDIRVSMVVCGVWTLLFTVPAFLVLKDRPTERGPRVGVVQSYRLVWRSVTGLWALSRHTVFFLLASALFRDGLAGVFAFGAVLAAGTFGLSAGEVIIFGAAANIVAGLATMGFGLLDDRIGPKRVILVSLGALVVLGLLVFVLHDGGAAVFWPLGLLMTVFVGPAQAASRSFLARLVPEGRGGEIFGLYATTGRVVSFLSPTAFGLFIALGALLTGADNTQYWGILGIVLVLAAGFAVMLPVKEHGEHTVA